VTLPPRSVLVTVGSLVALLAVLSTLVLRFGGGAQPDGELALAEAVPSAAPLPAAADRGEQQASRGRSRTSVDPSWIARISVSAGIPAPAVRAYADAQLRLAAAKPGCHLGWNTLAGIGWVESHHGTIGDRTLLADGRSSTTILGPALDGAKFAAIHSSSLSAQWHGDTVWEHAVGPLQFLASTWDRWGVDGDDDGVADPRDLDDAALTAARYLCADSHDLGSDAGWDAAVHSYNHDQAYVVNVANAANTYAQRAR
jgi:membrane-bound lytic murein transglycosylase B